ncbi:MAG: glycoprotein endopeptidase metalloprotease [marine bacterium B5-7]|nr:MAG: glycoprotein endopeptidase metalloprotease [marine bacterium B5-7]
MPAVSIDDSQPHVLRLAFEGILTANTLPTLWQQCIDAQQTHQPQQLIVDASAITHCDGAGISLFDVLKEKQDSSNKQFSLQGLAPKFQQLFALISQHPTDNTAKESPKLDPIARLGQATLNILDYLKANVIFLGEFLIELMYVLKHPKQLRWKDAWKFCEIVGPNALPIILLIGFLLGLIMGFQSSIALQQFGAEIYVTNLVGVSLIRELGPLMTAILITGRTASAFAAEIGTMTVNQEIDALNTMGLKPMRFLVLPRLFAATLMTPFLNIFMILAGLIGCAVVMQTLGFSMTLYLHQLQSAVTLTDLFGGLFKAFVFGIIIANIGCLHGLRTQQGASAVGQSTTQAVVSGIIMIAVFDGIFAIIYYALGL